MTLAWGTGFEIKKDQDGNTQLVEIRRRFSTLLQDYKYFSVNIDIDSEDVYVMAASGKSTLIPKQKINDREIISSALAKAFLNPMGIDTWRNAGRGSGGEDGQGLGHI